ncbi:hypothetical protein FRC01_000296 [Tulasnella sp. 417]|nr:hypothetical protein FRC01_000296 [Tulasnella sp. 417]
MENPQSDPSPCLADKTNGRIGTAVPHALGQEGLGAASGPSTLEGTPTWINLLPHELLLLIFELYAGVDTPVQHLVTLTLVCKPWQDIVEDAPNLWRCISGMEGSKRVRKGLERAKDSLLEINYSKNNAKTGQGAFFAEISGRIARWKSFILATDNPGPAVTLLTTTVAPNLRTFHLKVPWGQRHENEPVTLFRGESAPPRLADFRVRFIRVIVEPLRLSGLRSFELHEMPIISAKEVLRVLAASPALERCYLSGLASLNDFEPEHGRELLKREDPTIKLSHLRSLTLTILPVSFIHLLLSKIQAPTLQWCTVDCNIDWHHQSPKSELFTAQISHLTSAVTALTSKAQKIEITSYSNNHWILYVGSLSIGLGGLAFQYNHIEETLDWLFNCLDGQLKTLPIGLAYFELDVDSRWFTRLSSNLKITRLDVWGDPFSNRVRDDRSQDIISLLSQPLTSEPNQWLLPELESINLNVINADGKSKILEMVKARHSSIEAQRKKGPGDIAVVRPFREILLRGGSNKVSREVGPHAEFLDELQKAASDAEIWWEEVKWVGSDDSSPKVE